MEFDPIKFYQNLVTVPTTLEDVNLEEHYPKITSEDINTGYITRYFARQSNHMAGFISEISKTTYERIRSNSLYDSISLKWRISGQLDDIKGLTNVNTPTRLYTGVVTANLLTLEEADKQLKGMKTRILHPTQFYVGY